MYTTAPIGILVYQWGDVVERYSTKHGYMVEDITTKKIVCVCNPPGTSEGNKMAEYIVGLMNQDIK